MEFIKIQKSFARDYVMLHLIDYFKKFDFHIRFFKCDDPPDIELASDFWFCEQETNNDKDLGGQFVHDKKEQDDPICCPKKNFNFLLCADEVFVLNYPMTIEKLSFYFFYYSLDTFMKKYGGKKLYIQETCFGKKTKIIFSLEKDTKFYKFCLQYYHILFNKDIKESTGNLLPELMLHIELIRISAPESFMKPMYDIDAPTNFFL